MVTPKKTRTSSRDSSATRQRILDAVGSVLAEQGFAGVGVNAVARAAGVDKVLIYRYFGGMSELLRAYAEHGAFWPTIRELLGKDLDQISGMDLADVGAGLLAGHLRALQKRPNTQEIMRWELHQRNELTDELARAREQQGTEIVALLPIKEMGKGGLDVLAAAAIVHAGMTYLLLRSKTADVYLGVDLRSESGWKRIEATVRKMTETMLKANRSNKK